MSEILKAVSPAGEPLASFAGAATRGLDTLNGKTIGEVWNGSFEGQVSFPIIRQMLQARFPGVTIIPYSEFPLFPVTSLSPQRKAENLEALRIALLAKKCDAVITGNGG